MLVASTINGLFMTPLVESGRWDETLGDALARWKIDEQVRRDFVLPFFSACWGLKIDEAASLSARAHGNGNATNESARPAPSASRMRRAHGSARRKTCHVKTAQSSAHARIARFATTSTGPSQGAPIAPLSTRCSASSPSTSC